MIIAKLKKIAPWLLRRGGLSAAALVVSCRRLASGWKARIKGSMARIAGSSFGKIPLSTVGICQAGPDHFSGRLLVIVFSARDEFNGNRDCWFRVFVITPGHFGFLMIFVEPDRGCTILLAAVSLAILIHCRGKTSFTSSCPACWPWLAWGSQSCTIPCRLKRIFACVCTWKNPRTVSATKPTTGHRIALGAGVAGVGWV